MGILIDIVFICLTLAFFALSFGLLALCSRLMEERI
jgi:hypothetical protein